MKFLTIAAIVAGGVVGAFLGLGMMILYLNSQVSGTPTQSQLGLILPLNGMFAGIATGFALTSSSGASGGRYSFTSGIVVLITVITSLMLPGMISRVWPLVTLFLAPLVWGGGLLWNGLIRLKHQNYEDRNANLIN